MIKRILRDNINNINKVTDYKIRIKDYKGEFVLYNVGDIFDLKDVLTMLKDKIEYLNATKEYLEYDYFLKIKDRDYGKLIFEHKIKLVSDNNFIISKRLLNDLKLADEKPDAGIVLYEERLDDMQVQIKNIEYELERLCQMYYDIRQWKRRGKRKPTDNYIDIKQLKDRVSILDVLQQYNIPIYKNNIKCVSGLHEDENPSMKINKDYVYCFSCHSSYDIIGLTMCMEDCKFREALDILANKH